MLLQDARTQSTMRSLEPQDVEARIKKAITFIQEQIQSTLTSVARLG